MRPERWRRWKHTSEVFYTGHFRSCFLILAGRCCFRSVRGTSTTAVDYGPTPAAAIHYPAKVSRWRRAEDCARRWGSTSSQYTHIRSYIKRSWIKTSLNMNWITYLLAFTTDSPTSTKGKLKPGNTWTFPG